MTGWNYLELNKLCEAKGISNAKVYQNSLQWRWQRANYHAETANKIWSDHFLKGSGLRIPIIPDEQDYKLFLSYESQVESCVQSLHALADILAQIINVVVLQGKIKEDDVSIKTIQNKMQEKAIAEDVAIEVNKLLNDEAFKYIDAFCNTIKHRRLIMTTFNAEYGEGTRNEHGLIFEEFIFKGDDYPQTWSSDILKKYRMRLFELVTKIGLSINAYASIL